MLKFFLQLFGAKRSIHNILSTHSTTIAGIISAIILTPFILHRIGVTQYGIWVILNAIIGYFNFTKLGFNTKLLRDLSEGKETNVSKIMSSFFFCMVLIQLILLPIVAFGSYWVQIFVRPGEGANFSLVMAAFYLLYCTFFLDLLAGIFASVFYSKNRHYFVNQVILGKIIVNFGLILAVGYAHELNIFVLAVVSFFVSGINTVLLYFRSRKVSEFSIGLKFFDKKYIKVSLAPSFQYFVISVGALIIYWSDSLVISSFLGAAAVTSYAIGYKIVQIPQKLLWSVPDVLFPKISHFYANELWSDLALLIRKIFSVVVPCNIALSLVLYYFGTQILTWWVGAEYVIAKDILNIFIITYFVQTIAHTYGVIINAIGKQKIISYLVALEAGLNLSISIFLVQKIGLIGVALGTMIAHFCVTGWFACVYTHRHVKLNLKLAS